MTPDGQELDTTLRTWGDMGPTAIIGVICLALIYVILQVIIQRKDRKP